MRDDMKLHLRRELLSKGFATAGTIDKLMRELERNEHLLGVESTPPSLPATLAKLRKTIDDLRTVLTN